MLLQLPFISALTSNVITDHMLEYDHQALRFLYKSYSADSTHQLQTLFFTLNISMKNGRTMESHYSIQRRDQVRSQFSRATGELRSLLTIPKESILALAMTHRLVNDE